MSDAVVRISNLSKSYGSFRALEDVSLEIRRGEIFALLGPNGAGKTTLIGIVAGLVKRSAGTVEVDGRDVSDHYLHTRRVVGLVPQEVNFDPFFTVEELLRFQAGYFGRNISDARLDEILSALGLLSKRTANTRALSGGMKRRLLIAKALVHDPKVLFLDEPTAGVDVELRRDLWAYVRTLRERGTTIVLTTHYLEEAEELADRVGVIDRGRLLHVEDKRALIDRLGTRVVTVALETPQPVIPAALDGQGWSASSDGLSWTLTDRANVTLGARLEALFRAGIHVKDVTVRPPRLEDVFLQLVGSAK